MQEVRKIHRPVSEKTELLTNQPNNYYQQHRIYRTWLTPVQKEAFAITFNKVITVGF